MASRIRLVDGREITVALDGKRTVSALHEGPDDGTGKFVRFNTPLKSRVWVNPDHVAAIEDRPDLD